METVLNYVFDFIKQLLKCMISFLDIMRIEKSFLLRVIKFCRIGFAINTVTYL